MSARHGTVPALAVVFLRLGCELMRFDASALGAAIKSGLSRNGGCDVDLCLVNQASSLAPFLCRSVSGSRMWPVPSDRKLGLVAAPLLTIRIQHHAIAIKLECEAARL